MPHRPLYNCTVQLNGNRDNCVSLSDVTAAEIRLLQWLHGRSSESGLPVIDIVDTKRVVDRNDAAERARLAHMYRAGELTGPALVQQLFGVAGVALPAIYEPEEEPEDPGDLKAPDEETVLPVAEVAEKPKARRTKKSSILED